MSVNVGNTDVQLSTTSSSILAAGAAQQITLLKVTVVNTDTVAHTVTVNRVPNAGSPSASNALVSALAIGAGATVVLPLSGQSLVNQQSLYALASAASVVNLNIGYAYTP